MKALLINGSPHANGCTFTALSIVAEELHVPKDRCLRLQGRCARHHGERFERHVS